ncbi:rhomboid domain-containing protein 2 [Trichomycterus rosablanca]|uniref:rhomboid domain-containing protein 2 n=1 Tax=Trichomycterus rosablanca TaxID=2290929 RepID=UPI002F35DA45
MNVSNRFRHVYQSISRFVCGLEISSGIVCVGLVSCVLTAVAGYFNISADHLSLESSVFHRGHVHRLLTYSFYHTDVEQLLLSVTVLAVFCSGLEKGVGTVRFLHLLLLFASSVGLLHVLLELLLFSASSRSSVSGLIPVSLAMLGTVTISSRMRKAYLMGVNVPTAALPWLLMLIVTLLVPNTVLLCNVLAVVTGQMYGMGWFRLVEISESRACLLEKKSPFKWMKKMPGVQFVPASAEERRKILHTTCSPPPGSYPVQAYAPAPTFTTGTSPITLDGWPHSAFIQQGYAVPSLNSGNGFVPRFESSHGHQGHGHSHECGHGHSHGHGHGHQHTAGSSGMPVGPYAHPHFGPPVNMAARPFGASPHVTVHATAQASYSGHPKPPSNPVT